MNAAKATKSTKDAEIKALPIEDKTHEISIVEEEMGLIPGGQPVLVSLGDKIVKATQYVFAARISSRDHLPSKINEIRKRIRNAFPNSFYLPLRFSFSYQQVDQNSTYTNAIVEVTVLPKAVTADIE